MGARETIRMGDQEGDDSADLGIGGRHRAFYALAAHWRVVGGGKFVNFKN
jgi:hypothetical protein